MAAGGFSFVQFSVVLPIQWVIVPSDPVTNIRSFPGCGKGLGAMGAEWVMNPVSGFLPGDM